VKQITERTKTVPVLAETEVLVVGSGPGGLAAALGAAREGMDTMLVERYGCFGGGITHLCLRETRLQGGPSEVHSRLPD
jgi:ribulose 1,5-bisphosphate synthetase/thiazole synthase